MTTLGRYEIIDKLGAGSMGTVYRARDTVLDREIALKTIRTGPQVEPELRERFQREARACARLQHPSIVVVYDFGEIDQIAYIAMELLNGSDIRKIIDRRLEIPLAKKIEAMAQVCEALAYAHRHGIIHRDVKPSNLFIVDSKCTKVLDFGIARLPSSILTAAGRILGTPNYMAPEQILAKPSDARADLFSAAVVFFEFLVYSHPFKSDLIPRRIVEGEPDSLFDHDPKLPILLERILQRALAKDPEQRYSTGYEFAGDLRAILEALRQDASPTFSGAQLPSEREVHSATPEPKSPARSGEDSEEWRWSELRRLIAEFERAALQRDTAQARLIFAQLEAVDAADSRFIDAVQSCRTRLSELESERRQPDRSRVASSDQPGVRIPCLHCGASNRSAAVYCIKCGASMPAPPAEAAVAVGVSAKGSTPALISTTLFKMEASVPPPVQSISTPGEVVTKSYAGIDTSAEGPASSQRLPSRAWWKRALEWVGRQQRIALISAGGFLFLIVIGIIAVIPWQAPVQPLVATARVRSAGAFLYKNASQASTIVSVPKGERINILKMPLSQDQWVPAQFVSSLNHKVYRAGYMRLADLEGWDSANADNSLALIRMFHAGDSGGTDQAQLDALQSVISRFPGTRAAREANIDAAKLDLAASQALKDAGQPPSAWQSRLGSARAYLDAASDDPSLASGVDPLRRQLEALIADSAAPPPVRSTATPTAGPVSQPGSERLSKKKIEALLSDADSFWDQRNLDEAEKRVNRVLKIDKNNPHALDLQEKIKRRKELLEKY
jgi:serine/threonine protein kinase